MHLQQTKRESRKSGGPQYYFLNLSDAVKTYLRKKGAVPVALITPYGATKTHFFAISKDCKFNLKGKVVAGKVGCDRIQQGHASESIGESIRKWYNLQKGDFERIDVDVEIIDDAFYLTPLKVKLVNSKKIIGLIKNERSLTFTTDYISRFWKDHLMCLFKGKNKDIVIWSGEEINRVVSAHVHKHPHIQEPDLLRASGPLKHLGLSLGPYVGKGYDCLSEFNLLKFPPYKAPVEIKRHSKGFHYQIRKYGKDELSRAVILCGIHDLNNVPKNVDVIELNSMWEYIEHLKQI